MLKCSKEAFAACPDRKGCGCVEEATFTEGSDCDKFNRQIGSHVMTHADRIRAMSDEELAKLIGRNCLCEHIQNADSEFCANRDSCDNGCIVDWLRQPAEVSGDA